MHLSQDFLRISEKMSLFFSYIVHGGTQKHGSLGLQKLIFVNIEGLAPRNGTGKQNNFQKLVK